MRSFCPPLLLLSVGAVVSVNAQWDLQQEIQKWLTGAQGKVMSRLLNSEAYNASFNASFKELLTRGNLSSLSMDEARALPSNLWRYYGAYSLLTLKNSTLDLVTPYLSQRIKDEMEFLRKVNITVPQAIDRLKSVLIDTS
ncbi:uncharacterized protein LOC125178238, partial [Hyalella azteca]|uniref:Uncharacterized protein LOC125178238 n=1 Tax=Hyalella azteca TaxID=294128 RepID=A0A979FMS1_HYAAZ